MNIPQDLRQIGILFKKSSLRNISAKELLFEFNVLLFELIIMKETIQHLQAHDLSAFDSTIGDWKCQTRTSIIVDLIENQTFSDQEQFQALDDINHLIIKIEKLYNEINNYHHMQLQRFTKELHKTSMYAYLEKHQLLYSPSSKLTLLSLCFFTAFKNRLLPVFTSHIVSTNKVDRCTREAKRELCFLSIDYEQNLAKEYGTTEQKKAIEQVEIKNVQHMTATFISFLGIYKKMHAKQQNIIVKTLYFCVCGGVQKFGIETYISVNNTFVKSIKPLDPKQAVSVLEAYQFPGSLEQLQNLVGAINEEYIPQKYLKSCTCDNPTPEQNIESLDQALLAFFAQHPQFTNGADINWQGLGLADSNLKKEYEYLLTVPGFSSQNMSKILFHHMYPSTVEQALKPIEIPNRTPENSIKHPHHLPTYLHCFHSDTGGKTMMQCNC